MPALALLPTLAPVPVWTPPVRPGEGGYGPWNMVASVVAKCEVRTVATTTRMAPEWATAMMAQMALAAHGDLWWPQGRAVPPSGAWWATVVVEGGLALPDLCAIAPALSPYLGPNGTARDLACTAGHLFPGCSLRSAVGWLVASVVSPNFEPFTGHRLYEQWAREGFGADEWMYAAAGFTPVEADAALKAGTLGPSQALAMAVLRGASVPVGWPADGTVDGMPQAGQDQGSLEASDSRG